MNDKKTYYKTMEHSLKQQEIRLYQRMAGKDGMTTNVQAWFKNWRDVRILSYDPKFHDRLMHIDMNLDEETLEEE
jgi:hypothetical protein